MKNEIKYVMIGRCPACGRRVTRRPECDAAACDCSNPPRIIELRPVIILSGRTLKKFEAIADQAGVSLEHFVNAVIKFGIDKIKELGIEEVLK